MHVRMIRCLGGRSDDSDDLITSFCRKQNYLDCGGDQYRYDYDIYLISLFRVFYSV